MKKQLKFGGDIETVIYQMIYFGFTTGIQKAMKKMGKDILPEEELQKMFDDFISKVSIDELDIDIKTKKGE